MLRILVVDHRPLFVLGLHTTLAQESDLELLTFPSESQRLAQLCALVNPHLLLLNAHLPALHLPALLFELAQSCPATHLLLLLEPSLEDSVDLQFLLQKWGGNRNYSNRRTAGRLAHCPAYGSQRWPLV